MVIKKGGRKGWGGVGDGDINGWTEMHQAAYFGKYSTIQLLANEGLLWYYIYIYIYK